MSSVVAVSGSVVVLIKSKQVALHHHRTGFLIGLRFRFSFRLRFGFGRETSRLKFGDSVELERGYSLPFSLKSFHGDELLGIYLQVGTYGIGTSEAYA